MGWGELAGHIQYLTSNIPPSLSRPRIFIYYNEHRLELKLSPNLEWSLYIQSIAKDVGKMVSSLYGISKYLTPPAISTFTSDRSGRKWSTAMSVSSCDKRLHGLVGDELGCKPLINLLLFLWKMFRRATFLSSTKSNSHS